MIFGEIRLIISFLTTPIYDMSRVCDMDKPCLHLVYDMWNTMIEKVELAICKHEGMHVDEFSSFHDVVWCIKL